MADPFTLAAIGATAGAVLTPKDPLKGALIGGTAGFTGGTMLAPAAGATVAGTAATGGAAAAAPVAGSAAAPFVPTVLGGATPTIASTLPANLGSAGSVAAGGFGNTVGTTGLLGGGGAAAASSSGMTPFQQLYVANQLIGRGQQSSQPMPNAPVVQTRPYTGMKLPANAMQQEEERLRMMYAMPPMPQIRLI